MQNPMHRLSSLTLPVLLSLSGCMVGPNYHRATAMVPDRFGPATQPAPIVDLEHWWESFDDPMLNSLVDRAVAANLDVRLAEVRVRKARATVAFNRASLFPTLDSSGTYSRSRASKNAFGVGSVGSSAPSGGGTSTGSGGTSTGAGATAAAPTAFSLGESNLYEAGFDAGWEVDVFGGTRRAIEAAQDTLEAQIEARRNALVTLLSEVAQNYIMLRGFQHELAIVQSNVAAQQNTLKLQKDKLQAGIAPRLTVTQAEAQVATTESQIPTLETEIQQAIHRLGVLLNRDPDALESELIPMAALPVGPATIPPGLPSELVRRRPDIRQAERQVAAATANIGVATADLFPKFSITGSLGLESLNLKTFTNSASTAWSIGPSVSWRVFDAGQIWANIHVQNARQQEALIQYQQAVLQSLSEVDDALVAYNREQVRRESLRQAVAANLQSVDLATQLNNAGVVDFLNVLTAQLSLYESQDQLAQSEQAVSTDLIALFKALGGGWKSTDGQAVEAISGAATTQPVEEE